MTKPKVKIDPFSDHCGDCRFCHPGELSNFNCWVEPPVYSHWEADEPVFVRGQAEIKLTDPGCKHYTPRNPQ